MTAIKLPEIWWTCACTVCDPHDNEWVEYVDAWASTKMEAYAQADSAINAKGLAMVACNVVPFPERRTPAPLPALPAPEKAAQAPATAPVQTTNVSTPFFDTAFFTKYKDTTIKAYVKEGV